MDVTQNTHCLSYLPFVMLICMTVQLLILPEPMEGAPDQTIICDMDWTSEAIGNLVKNALDLANHFEGSAEEAQVAIFLKQLGIKYSKITKDEFVTLMGILRKSDMLKSPGSKRGKGNLKKR